MIRVTGKNCVNIQSGVPAEECLIENITSKFVSNFQVIKNQAKEKTFRLLDFYWKPKKTN